ncbi:MAG: hypothetical protein ACJAS2_002605, partial [Pseudohongiellaceae bacterium]
MAVVGEAFARNPNGEIRELSAGDALYEGDTLVTRTGSEVKFQTVDGARYDLKKPTVLLVTNDFLAGDGPLVDETELDGTTLDIFEREFGTEGLFSFRELGSDADALLSDSFTEGHNFFRLGRINDPLSPLSFDADLTVDAVVYAFGGGQQGTANTAGPYTPVDLSITVGDVTVAEGSNAEFTVDFSGTRAGSFEISLSSDVAGGTAEAGDITAPLIVKDQLGNVITESGG